MMKFILSAAVICLSFSANAGDHELRVSWTVEGSYGGTFGYQGLYALAQYLKDSGKVVHFEGKSSRQTDSWMERVSVDLDIEFADSDTCKFFQKMAESYKGSHKSDGRSNGVVSYSSSTCGL